MFNIWPLGEDLACFFFLLLVCRHLQGSGLGDVELLQVNVCLLSLRSLLLSERAASSAGGGGCSTARCLEKSGPAYHRGSEERAPAFSPVSQSLLQDESLW